MPSCWHDEMMFISSLNYFRQRPIQLFCWWTFSSWIFVQMQIGDRVKKVLIISVTIIIIIIKGALKMKWFCSSATAAPEGWVMLWFGSNAMLLFFHSQCVEVEHAMNSIYNSYSYKLSTDIWHIKLLSFKCFVSCSDVVVETQKKEKITIVITADWMAPFFFWCDVSTLRTVCV